MNILIVFAHPEPLSLNGSLREAAIAQLQAEAARLRERMRNLATEAPLAYRKQNSGDYQIPAMAPRESLDGPGDVGFALHLRKD